MELERLTFNYRNIIGEVFEYAIQPYSGKHRYADRETDNVRSHNTIPMVGLLHNKLMYYHGLIVFYITDWIEYEPSSTFSTPTDNWF